MVSLVRKLVEHAIGEGCRAELQRSELGELSLHFHGEDQEGSLRGVLRFYGPSRTFGEGHDGERERSLDALQAAAEAAGAVLTWPRKESVNATG